MADLEEDLQNIVVLGSGNWGTTMARHIAINLEEKPELAEYTKTVKMWVPVPETTKDGKNLVDVINRKHVNPNYLPGISLPENLVAYEELGEAVDGADVIVMGVPHQFVRSASEQLSKYLPPEQAANVRCISLAKGIDYNGDDHTIKRMTQVISEVSGIPYSHLAALSGNNIASEVAAGQFADTNIASFDPNVLGEMYDIFHRDYFPVHKTSDMTGVEFAGALKNIVAILVGMARGLGDGANTQSSLMRRGVEEMIQFSTHEAIVRGVNADPATFLGPAGWPDMITTCSAGRNSIFGEYLGEHWKEGEHIYGSDKLDEIETELFKGQKVQGKDTTIEVYHALEALNLLDEFPMFRDAYRILYQGYHPRNLIKTMEAGGYNTTS